MSYREATVSVDSDGITIRRYGFFGSPRTIPFGDVVAMTESRLGSLGRWRLVGAGPGGGSRNWYGWDSGRRSKKVAYALDVGRFWRPTITPDDPESFRTSLPSSVEIH